MNNKNRKISSRSVSYSLWTKKRSFVSASLLDVEVGTTGRRGGDSGNGGRTYLRLAFSCGDVQMRAKGPDENPEVTLLLGGDAELETLAEGLRFAADVLESSLEDGTMPEAIEVRQLCWDCPSGQSTNV